MTVRQFLNELDRIFNQLGNWLMSLTLGEAFFLFCGIIIVFVLFFHFSSQEEESYGGY